MVAPLVGSSSGAIWVDVVYNTSSDLYVARQGVFVYLPNDPLALILIFDTDSTCSWCIAIVPGSSAVLTSHTSLGTCMSGTITPVPSTPAGGESGNVQCWRRRSPFMADTTVSGPNLFTILLIIPYTEVFRIRRRILKDIDCSGGDGAKLMTSGLWLSGFCTQ